MQQFATPTTISTVLNIPAGRIQLIAADRTDTTVQVLPADASKSRDMKAAEQITVTYHDSVLRIEAPEPTHRLLGNSGSVEITVQLPAGSHIEATSAAAELRGVGRLGDIVFEGGHRSVKLDEVAGARLTAHDATVTVGRLTGPADISTQRGDIQINQAVTGTVTLSTQQGDITIGAAPGASASLDAGTGYGRVHNTLKNTDGSAAALTIHATTTHGDITARSL
ncbi:DUF4097 family beta strand repeat-containing protein [Streptomyces cupreus]|uniref:DUF4097 family beta strand repeat protein n=1 Tax=Streptomyces cupreus TaxID=2759956 RepID=A0A7X1JCQ5_9ACTN|nr:DUF4097 family beta strand repeat-containing protein [Streptomyces cupreus]MBC2908356.1 DUF4097 family beta strand repeat protein [Streptomyces cupreus]